MKCPTSKQIKKLKLQKRESSVKSGKSRKSGIQINQKHNLSDYKSNKSIDSKLRVNVMDIIKQSEKSIDHK